MKTEAYNIKINKINRKFAKISFDVSQFGDEYDKDVIFINIQTKILQRKETLE